MIIEQHPMRPNASPIAFLLMFAISPDVFATVTQQVSVTHTLQPAHPTLQEHRITSNSDALVEVFTLLPQDIKQVSAVHCVHLNQSLQPDNAVIL